MFDQFVGERVFCGVDVGSQRIKASLLKAKDLRGLRLMDISEIKTNGFQDASVSDLGELADSVQTLLNALARKNNVRIKDVYLGFSGDLIEMRTTKSAIPLIERGSKIITNTDIKKVNIQARLLGVKMEEEVLHDFPQSYEVDDINIAMNPLGLYGRKLEVSTLLTVCNGTPIRNIVKAVQQAGFDVADTYFSAYAASRVILDEKQLQEGCCLLDIGARVTNILIFRDGVLKFIDKINWGGRHVVQKIAEDLQVSLDLSEEIKKTHTSALKTDQRNDEEILVKRDSAYIPIKREAICNAIDPEISLFVQSLKEAVTRSALFGQINGGITAIGGGSLLPGLIERIEEAMGLPVRLGKLTLSNHNPQSVAVYAPAVGLAQLGAHKYFSELFLLNNQAGGGNNRLINKVREFYHEYF